MKKRNTIFLVVTALLIIVICIVGLFVNQRPNQNAAAHNWQTQIEVAADFKGKNIRFLVPSAPGGGFDEYSRLLAPYFEKYTGANINVVNMPGAGGMKAANELYSSPKNGLTVAILNGSGMVINKFVGLEGANYQLDKFEYLGRVNSDPRVLTVATKSTYLSLEDILNAHETVKIGVTGLGGSGYLDAVITREALGLNMQVIHGFDSSSAVRQSMLRGNIAGTWGSWGSAKSAVNAELERPILQSGIKRAKDLFNVPNTFELIEMSENPERTRAILVAWDSLISVGRPIATTPGTPAERIQFLRDAFRLAMQDPDFVEMTIKADRPIDYVSAEEMLDIIKAATEMDNEIEALFIKAILGEL